MPSVLSQYSGRSYEDLEKYRERSRYAWNSLRERERALEGLEPLAENFRYSENSRQELSLLREVSVRATRTIEDTARYFRPEPSARVFYRCNARRPTPSRPRLAIPCAVGPSIQVQRFTVSDLHLWNPALLERLRGDCFRRRPVHDVPLQHFRADLGAKKLDPLDHWVSAGYFTRNLLPLPFNAN